MSYDLFFRARTGRDLPPLEAQRAWALDQPHMQPSQDGARLWYENPDTGVYASIDTTLAADGSVLGIAFNLSYARPSFFALEAMPVVCAFAKAFDLLADDPQGDADGPGPVDAGALIARWNNGNASAITAMSEVGVDAKPTMPRSHALAFWKYCFHYEAIKKEFFENFVPTLRLVSHEGRALRLAFLTEPTPYVLPPCDLLAFRRNGATQVIEARRFRELVREHLIKEEKPAPLEYITDEPFFDGLLDAWDQFLAATQADLAPSDVQPLAADGFIDPE